MSFRENGAFLSCGGGFRGSPLGEGVCGRPARGCSQGETSPFPKTKKPSPFSESFFILVGVESRHYGEAYRLGRK